MDNLTPITREEMLMNDEPMTPITREEKILAGEDLNPVTRREYFLKKYRHAGGDVMVEGLEVTANGTYTAPEGKAYSPVEVDVPLPENAYLLKTASGSLVSFSDGADLPMPSFICNIDAVQDLHGYDSPWVGGAGKNKLPYFTAEEKNGIRLTYDNGVVVLNGTASANTFFTLTNLNLASNTYTFSANNNATNNNVHISLREIGAGSDFSDLPMNSSDKHNTYQDVSIGQVTLYVLSGTQLTNFRLPLQIEVGGSKTTFAPYSNICPISGHTSAVVTMAGKNFAKGVEVGTSKNMYANSLYIDCELKPNTIYTLSFDGLSGQQFYANENVFSWAHVAVEDARATLLVKTKLYIDKSSPAQYSNNKWIVLKNDMKLNEAPVINNVQLEVGSATTYEPYNPNSQTIQVSWQTEAGEVFGGYVDLVSGELTVTHKIQTGFTRGSQDSSNKLYNIGTISDIKAYTNASAISPYYVDSMFEKMSLQGARAAETPSITHHDHTFYVGGYIGKEAELDTLLGTLQVKYELETPITYQLTPTQIKSLLGNNNAWCDTGDVTLEYFGKEVTG